MTRLITRQFLTLGAALGLCSACAIFPFDSDTADNVVEPDKPLATKDVAKDKLKKVASKPKQKKAPARRMVALGPAKQVGDYSVYRFSGSRLSEPLTLMERVVARDGDVLEIEYELEGEEHSAHLRVKINNGEIVSVHKVENDELSPASLRDYETMMELTAFQADANQGQLDKANSTCLIGERETPCTKTRYKVLAGEAEAIMTVSSSDEWPGLHLEGEVSNDDGELLYRAQLVEAEKASLSKEATARR